MKYSFSRWLKTIAILLLPSATWAQFYSGSQMDFGKNRVQYQDFRWEYFKFDKYEVYFNTGGKELAISTARTAKKQIAEIEKIFDYTFDERLQYIVYNKQEDFKQSNISLSDDDQYNIGGVTRIVGRKIFIYYEDDHIKLEDQIRSGTAEVLINQMMYGGNVKDVLRNSTLLNIPEWFQRGLVSYVGKGWNTELDNRVRDGIQSGRYDEFNHLTGDDAVFAGHSIWNYIAERYGTSVISNILYMTKVSRNVENAFLFVLGVNVRNLAVDWKEYYLKKYNGEGVDSTRTLPATAPILAKPKSTRIYSQLKVSPDGQNVVYATNELGQYKLWLYNTQTNKLKRLLKREQKLDRINDFSYPLMSWHPSGKIFAYIYEDKGETFLVLYTLETGEKIVKPVYNFVKILDFAYSPDGKSLVMSAVQNGQTDIFIYSIAGGGAEPITKDIYDDINPRFIDGGRSIVFSSNRDLDTLKSVSLDTRLNRSYDLFVYNYQTRSNVLRRITHTPGVNEVQVAPWDSTHFSYISDNNGIRNRYVSYFDSTIAYVDTIEHYRFFARSFAVTNYNRNIIEQDVSPAAGKYGEIIYNDGRYRMFIGNITDFASLKPLKLINTSFRDDMIEDMRIDAELDSIENAKKDIPKKKTPTGQPVQTVNVFDATKDKKPDNKIDINNYQFENGTKKPDTTPPAPKPDTVVAKTDTVPAGPKDEFILPLARNLKVQYSTEYVVSQLDNSFLNTSYQRFTGGGGAIYLNPGFTGLFKISMSDLLEDHRLIGGVRLSGDLSNNEYVMQYDDRTRRLDRQLLLHRQAFLSVQGFGTFLKIHTHEARYALRWPFNEVAAVRGTVSYRNDRTVYQATDYANLLKGNEYLNWAGLKGEFIFDNTRPRGLNLYNGFRMKAWVEFYERIDVDSLFSKPNFDFKDLWTLGVDARYYQKVHREIIWASRIAASTSLGQQRLIYYMGGVDNWLGPKFNQSVRIPTPDDFSWAYQTLATPMRGFHQNIRNGNSFAVINSELRVPLFRYLLNRPIRSDFINNFQVVGFGDIGTAWTGSNPYSEENSLNTTIIGAAGNPITVILKNHDEPIVGGYGFGIRSRLWGYFVRADWAWGVENKVILPRVTYLSFSLDF